MLNNFNFSSIYDILVDIKTCLLIYESVKKSQWGTCVRISYDWSFAYVIEGYVLQMVDFGFRLKYKKLNFIENVVNFV